MSKDIREDNLKYLSKLSKRKFSRVIAWICLFIIAMLVIATLITGIMGSRLFMPFLALMITVPFFMYIALWLGKLLNGAGSDKDEEKENDDKDE
ncbi:MAG: hypothetical protein J6P57_05960 [Lachnospiraceae bacterium]|nr:hypothetical protein [Lachnospiraceae bacterium]